MDHSAAPRRLPAARSVQSVAVDDAMLHNPAIMTQAGQGWATMNIEGTGEVSGVVVGFDTAVVVVALALPVDIIRNRGVLLTLGIDGRTVEGVSGTTTGTSKHPDGRQCIAIRLNRDDGDAPSPAASRRAKARVPFEAKVDAMVIASRTTADKNYRFQAIDLSSRGLGVTGARTIATKSRVLLRFALPPHRGATMQIRAVVAYFQRSSEAHIHVGFEFERVTAAQLTQLNNAIMHISHPRRTSREPS